MILLLTAAPSKRQTEQWPELFRNAVIGPTIPLSELFLEWKLKFFGDLPPGKSRVVPQRYVIW